MVGAHLDHSGAEVIITLMDLFVMDKSVWGGLKVPWIAWTPIDHEDIGYPTLERLRLVKYPVAMSNFGASEMVKAGVNPIATIYHTVDTETFKPLDQRECREELNIDPDCTLVGIVAANKGDRKQIPLQLEAIKKWMDSNPDRNIKIFLHLDPTPSMDGWDMKKVVEKLGLHGRVYTTNQYFAVVMPLDQEQLVKVYNSFDVLLAASAGEGFGIPIVEAQACGIPVITHSVTSMPELTINGYSVGSKGKGLASHYGYQFMPDVNEITYRLECVYRRSKHPEAERGRSWVVNNCSLPVIATQWGDLLEAVALEMEANGVSDAARTVETVSG